MNLSLLTQSPASYTVIICSAVLSPLVWKGFPTFPGAGGWEGVIVYVGDFNVSRPVVCRIARTLDLFDGSSGLLE